ncbi:MAG TPA: pectinesterase family protein [Candidatus Acidoferrales bacterium]|nr:pectinesterase family protein [Candidatus Acidoferrales bacterium]
MKRKILFQSLAIASLIVLMVFDGKLVAQSAGDFRSHQTGNWSNDTTWEQYNGTTWVTPAPSTPTGTENITIQSGHTVTIDVTLSITGYLKNQGTISGATASNLAFGSGGTYEHAEIGGSLPTATWGTGSTCLVTGSTSAQPGNTVQNLYNFTWNCPSQSANVNLGWDNVVIGGNVTVTSCNGISYQLRLTSAATTRTIRILGNVIVNGGYLTVSGSSSSAQYNTTVMGNIDIRSGKFSLCTVGTSYTANGTWWLCGDSLVVSSGANFGAPSNPIIGTRLIFAKKNGTQYYLNNGGTNGNLNYGIDSNATVQLNSPLTVGNSTTGFLVMTSGKFVTTSTNLMTLAVGASVTTGSGYVSGPLATIVNISSSKALTLPVGKDSVYRPVILTLTQDAATSTTYTTELINSTPASNTLPSTLDAVSTARYFHIVKGTGANVSSATIQLNYDTNDGVDVSNKDYIRIAKDDGAGNWINLGGSGTANNTGSILSNTFGTSTSLGTLTTNDFVIAHVNPASVPVPPTLTTDSLINISTTFATSGGVISNDGNAAITAKGVCWNTTGTPTTSDNFTNDGTTSTPYTSSITGLSAGTTYYVRAYATNSAGTGYGNQDTLVTLAVLSAPTVTTSAVTNIVNTTATGNGNVTAWGGSTVTDRGVCWSTSHNPTLANDYNSGGTGTGAFTAPIGGLTLGTTYYVRAYATNSTGTAYGNEVSFATPAPQPDVYKIVAKDGSGDYTTITDAFNAVTSNYTGHWFIGVKNGTYYEKPLLASGKINVVLIGQNRDSTIITYDDYAGDNRTTNGVTSSGTSTSYTCAIDANDFQAQNITFQNTSNAYAPGSTSAQAVALRTHGDRQAYYNCKMTGYQDTYYTWGGSGPGRIYNKNCYIEGAVDFIFGEDVALFDSCTIYCNRAGGTLTAAATYSGYSYGYVFSNCTIASIAAGDTGCDNKPMTSFYLGRPWQNSPETVFINCYEPGTVNSAGWTTMGPAPSLYSEHGCYGPGSALSRAVIWTATSQPSAITDSQAALYTVANIFSKSNAGSGFSYAANWTPSMIVANSADLPLPVEMVSFTASYAENGVTLNWSMSSELNNSGWDVERAVVKSGAQPEWQKIGHVNGTTNSTELTKYSFVDRKALSGIFNYRLKQMDINGNYKYSNPIQVKINIPTKIGLWNYPNPFNPTATLRYAVPKEGKVTLKVYNAVGQLVATLVDENKDPGMYEIPFEGSAFSSGVYFARLNVNDQVMITKMLMIK